MRMMSFSMTTAQFKDGSKDVTRRFGWWFLKPGDRLMAVEKAMGLKKGEKVKALGEIEVVSARREPLSKMMTDESYGRDECRREGFPEKHPHDFVWMLLEKYDCDADKEVNRIEFKRISDNG